MSQMSNRIPVKSKLAQSARFIEAAKKAEADETGKKFEQAFRRIMKPLKRPATKKK
jgi:hypothetical protein